MLASLCPNLKSAIGRFLIAYMKQTKKQTMLLSTFIANVHKAYRLHKFNLQEALNTTNDKAANAKSQTVSAAIHTHSHDSALTIRESRKSRTAANQLTKMATADYPHSESSVKRKESKTKIHCVPTVCSRSIHFDTKMRGGEGSEKSPSQKGGRTRQPRLLQSASTIESKHSKGERERCHKLKSKSPEVPRRDGEWQKTLIRFRAADAISEEAELIYELKQQQKHRLYHELQLREGKSHSGSLAQSMMGIYNNACPSNAHGRDIARTLRPRMLLELYRYRRYFEQ